MKKKIYKEKELIEKKKENKTKNKNKKDKKKKRKNNFIRQENY